MEYTEKTAEKHLNTLPTKERSKIIDRADAILRLEGIRVSATSLRRTIVEILNEPYLAEQRKIKELRAKKIQVQQALKQPQQSFKQPQQTQQALKQPQQTQQDFKQPQQVLQLQKDIKKKEVFNKTVPAILIRNNIELSQFKFRLTDTDEIIYKKVRYLKDLIKGKSYFIKKAILEFYEIQIDSEKRSNQYYLYGWKNLNNRKYKFYVGKSSIQQ